MSAIEALHHRLYRALQVEESVAIGAYYRAEHASPGDPDERHPARDTLDEACRAARGRYAYGWIEGLRELGMLTAETALRRDPVLWA